MSTHTMIHNVNKELVSALRLLTQIKSGDSSVGAKWEGMQLGSSGSVTIYFDDGDSYIVLFPESQVDYNNRNKEEGE